MKNAYLVLGLLLLVAGASTVAMASITTPEIAAGSAGSAVALVSGMLLVIRGRRRK